MCSPGRQQKYTKQDSHRRVRWPLAARFNQNNPELQVDGCRDGLQARGPRYTMERDGLQARGPRYTMERQTELKRLKWSRLVPR